MQQEEINLKDQAMQCQQEGIDVQIEIQQKIQGRWTDEQHYRFLQGLFKYGKNWKQIQLIVQTRICSQVRSHAQKYFIKLHKIIKDRKKQKNKNNQLTDLQKQILSKFNETHITNQTPQILINLLQNNQPSPKIKQFLKQSIPNYKIQPKQPQNSYTIKYHSSNYQTPHQNLISKNNGIEEQSSSIQRNQNIINQYYNPEQNQQKSFFLRLIQHNVQHFRKGKDFIDFIDFQRKCSEQLQIQEEMDSATTLRYRRSSFILVDDLQNDQKLKQALEKLKTGQN